MSDKSPDPHIRRPLYKDNSIKVSPSKDSSSDQYMKYPYNIDLKDRQPDFKALHKILNKELDKSLSFQDAVYLGKELLDIYYSMYFEQD